MIKDFVYSESIFHKALPYLLQFSLYALVIKFLYLRMKEGFYRKKNSEKKINLARTKIAYEMHQDIGNDLNALVFKIKNWHLKNGNQPSEEYRQLEKSAIQVIAKVNDIVWSLNAQENNLFSLQNYLIAYAEETFASTTIEYNIIPIEKLIKRKLQSEVKKNIYLIYKEAINNILKHAHASQVTIKFEYKSSIFGIEIADNGKGFDVDQIIKGNGLDSMNKRISQLHGKIAFIKNNPEGTIIKFEIKV